MCRNFLDLTLFLEARAEKFLKYFCLFFETFEDNKISF